MKNYHRILVAIPNGARGDALLQRAAALTHGQNSKLMVVRTLDTRSGVESDGPLGMLPEDRAGRLLPAAKRNLDLQLARNNLGWAEATVAHGEPMGVLDELIRSWRPDLLLACANDLPDSIATGVDILSVGCTGLFGRFLDNFRQPAVNHA